MRRAQEPVDMLGNSDRIEPRDIHRSTLRRTRRSDIARLSVCDGVLARGARIMLVVSEDTIETIQGREHGKTATAYFFPPVLDSQSTALESRRSAFYVLGTIDPGPSGEDP